MAMRTTLDGKPARRNRDWQGERPRLLQIAVCEADDARIRLAAHEAGLTVSSYLRQLVLAGMADEEHAAVQMRVAALQNALSKSLAADRRRRRAQLQDDGT